MKTKDYIKKYNFGPRVSGKPFEFPKEIYKDFMSELITQLEFNKATDNLAGFNNSVRVLKMKFDGVSNKAYGILEEKHWNFMFATMIVPLREQYCSREVKAFQEKREARIKEREEREKWEKEQLSGFNFNPWDFVWMMFYNDQKTKPLEAFETLGLESNATFEEAENQYKTLIWKYHPNNKETGDHDKCIALNKARADIKAYFA